ncbi:MAG: hypothetical protein JW850_12855 [Thermoflexales bacterium]|nr:hypothetical protein [Thermoflexales bacterium]
MYTKTNRIAVALTVCLLLAAVVAPAVSAQTFIVPNQNGGFDQGLAGWQTFALDQKTNDPYTSYWPPVFKIADDQARNINGATLQIDNYEFTKWRAGIYQQVSIQPGAEVWFTVRASAFTDSGGGERDWIGVRLGLDPKGGDGCAGAAWGDPVYVGHMEQSTLTSLKVKANARKVTICIMGEPQYAFYKNALFLDDVVVLDPPALRQSFDYAQGVAQGEALVDTQVDTTLGSVCTWAFDDANANGARDDREGSVKGVLFTLVDAQGQARETESHSPACFAGLGPGVYTLKANDLKGYQTTTPQAWTVTLDPGQTLDLPPVGLASTSWSAAARKARAVLPLVAGVLLLVVVGLVMVSRRTVPAAPTSGPASVLSVPDVTSKPRQRRSRKQPAITGPEG